MKQGLSLVALAQKLESLSAQKVDLVANTRRMHMDNDARLLIDAEHIFNPTQNCHNQIAARLDIPTAYYNRMKTDDPKLLADNVNAWLWKSNENRMIRGLGGNARAFLSDRYHRIDNEHVMETVLPVLMETGGIVVQSCNVTENKLYIKATSKNVVAEVKSKRVGDFVEAGVLITNSEIGNGSLSIKPFLNFLICTNGMTRDKLQFMKYHVGRKVDASEFFLSDATKSLEDAAVLSKVRDIIRSCMSLDLLQAEVLEMEEAAQQQITGDVVKGVEKVGEIFQLSKIETSGVLRNLINSGDLSRYGMMNAVTAFAETVESYDRATEIEALGGRVLDFTKKDWVSIAEAAGANCSS
jgi:hypothetical protein